MLTWYCFAIEVSVSPRVTTWVLPDSDGRGRGAFLRDARRRRSGVGFTLRRLLCWSFRICCESASILAFCSSIFLLKRDDVARSDAARSCATPARSGKAAKQTDQESENERATWAKLGISARRAGKLAASLRFGAFAVAFFHA